jgi:hypothetical protein
VSFIIKMTKQVLKTNIIYIYIKKNNKKKTKMKGTNAELVGIPPLANGGWRAVGVK